MARYNRLADYEFVDCMVRSREILGFVAQRFEDSDPLEPRDTAAFFYYPSKPPERQWAFAYLGEATGISGTAVMSPAERWFIVGGVEGDRRWARRANPIG